MKLSFVIINYNYAKYLGAAIDSAIAVEWYDKEIIVADDGSTDNSREVILAYGPVIIPLFLSNGGQNSACNAALEHCTGDIIIFLDSDDIIFSSVAETVRSAWYDGISKLQWSLVITDRNLTPLGGCFPTYRREPTPEWVRQMVARTGHYPFSLGGAWARRFLSQVFPVPVRERVVEGGANGDCRIPVVDHYLSKLAPFFGDVVCISHHKPQGVYRMHGSNNHYRAQAFEHYAATSMEQLECAYHVNRLLRRLNIASHPLNVERDENVMKRQLVCQRLNLHPRQNSTLFKTLLKYWCAVRLCDASMISKVKWYMWSICVAAGPRQLTVWAVRRRDGGV